MKRLFLLLSIFVILGGFFSCDDALLLLSSLEDNVMAANAMYLEVIDTVPEEGDLEVYPGQDIIIKFDRAVLESSIFDNIEIWDNTDNSIYSISADQIDFNKTLNLLTISPKPFFEGLHEYTITIKPGFLSIDYEKLRNILSWSFRTKNAPVGYAESVYRSGVAQAGFASSLDPLVDIQVTTSLITDSYYYSFSESNVQSAIDSGSGSWEPILSDPFELNINISGEGPVDGDVVQIYFAFYDSDENQFSEISSVPIIYDTSPPAVSIGTGSLIENIANEASNPSVTAIVADTNFSAGVTYNWNTTGTKDLTFGTGTSVQTTVTTFDNSDTTSASFNVQVTDAAGNIGTSNTRAFVRDTIAPALTLTCDTILSSKDDKSEIGTSLLSITDWKNSVSGASSLVLYLSQYYKSAYEIIEKTEPKDPYTTPELKSGFKHKIELYASDSYGNETSIVKELYIDEISPSNKEPNISTEPIVNWSDYSGVRIYKFFYKNSKAIFFTEKETDISEFDFGRARILLTSGANYNWYYEVYTIYKFTTILSYTSPEYSFTTK